MRAVIKAIVLGGVAVATTVAIILVVPRARSVTQSKMGPVPTLVVTAAVTSEAFAINKRTIGSVEPMAQVVVKPRVDSQIATQVVRDGAMVSVGDVLFTLDDRELKAQVARDQAQVAKDRATVAKTKANLERQQDLVKKGVATPQTYEQALADQGAAAATLDADIATVDLDQIHLGYTIITAPISGRAGVVNVTPGNLVKTTDTGAGLVTITQVDPIRLALQLSERQFGEVHALFANGTPPHVAVYRSGSSDVLASGPATFLDSAIDPASGTITLKAEFPNHDARLWPGMFVDVDITLQQLPHATVVPTVAVQIGPEGSYVFVAKSDHTVEQRPLVIAATDGSRTAVRSGLAIGERVVVEGQGRLTNGSPIREAAATQPRAPDGEASDGRVSKNGG